MNDFNNVITSKTYGLLFHTIEYNIFCHLVSFKGNLFIQKKKKCRQNHNGNYVYIICMQHSYVHLVVRARRYRG